MYYFTGLFFLSATLFVRYRVIRLLYTVSLQIVYYRNNDYFFLSNSWVQRLCRSAASPITEIFNDIFCTLFVSIFMTVFQISTQTISLWDPKKISTPCRNN